MLRKTLSIVAAIAIVGSLSVPAFAQRGGGRGPAAGQTVDKIKMLKPNLYEITGGGANTLIRVTNQGLIVVDTKNPPPSPDDNYARVMEEIKSVTNQPVKFVINTHHHPDHVGGIAELVQHYRVPVYGPRNEPIPTLTRAVSGFVVTRLISPPRTSRGFSVTRTTLFPPRFRSNDSLVVSKSGPVTCNF